MPVNVSGLLLEAAYLMAVGMLVVFLFLGALIGAMTLVAWLNRQFPEAAVPLHNSKQAAAPSTPALSSGIIAAITAAVHQHRNK
ncbi:OadG family protein [Paraglaciecola hydrolytica]|uniref:Probable oxaloacetate decarboxylase gamma chain n=1 Tax=Paraglaciecola hydrolytica TaxID=1799789 RepID=A0A148KNV1_9ALTE|nr:OadG family transporter subunit [Paraglaciecola hydrolytica]KXI27961.1 hypothetical protein AX660_20900 [Paraglaciecola hydrolytica]